MADRNYAPLEDMAAERPAPGGPYIISVPFYDDLAANDIQESATDSPENSTMLCKTRNCTAWVIAMLGLLVLFVIGLGIVFGLHLYKHNRNP